LFVLSALANVACDDSDRLNLDSDASRPDAAVELPQFSFFVTSLRAMQRLSNSQVGFGGDLRFGKEDGLSGADEICRQIAEGSLPGAGRKPWRAFLSVTSGRDGDPVHAIDRIGEGPWFDRIGRLVAQNLEDLARQRPAGADSAIIDDLPNEEGIPNHAPDGLEPVDNHDILTGTDAQGHLYGDLRSTCQDWTSSVGADGRPRVGHSWPRNFGDFGDIFGGMFPPPLPDGGGFPFPFDPSSLGDISKLDMVNWMSSLDEAGCAPGVNVIEMGPPNLANPTVGSGGGYGGIYCFSEIP
jgi:hypothetical protein